MLVAVVAAVALLYFTIGIRLGFVTLSPTYLFNAQGHNSYSFETYEDTQAVGVTGTCRVRKGRAVLRLIDPSGNQVAGRTCPRGFYTLELMGKGQQGFYRLEIDFEHFSGVMDLKETRSGAQ